MAQDGEAMTNPAKVRRCHAWITEVNKGGSRRNVCRLPHGHDGLHQWWSMDWHHFAIWPQGKDRK